MNLLSVAQDAKKAAARDPFAHGQVMAYYDIISTAQEQARLLGVEFADRSLAAFNADKELLGEPAKA